VAVEVEVMEVLQDLGGWEELEELQLMFLEGLVGVVMEMKQI